MVDYRQPPLGYLVRAPQENLDSPLDESARDRAEEAARFLSFERIGGVASCDLSACIETALILLGSFCPGQECVQGLKQLEHSEVICSYLMNAREPLVLVLADREIREAVQRLCPANVCGEFVTREIVGPGGIVSVHRGEGFIKVVARTMILDFGWAECSAEAANAGT